MDYYDDDDQDFTNDSEGIKQLRAAKKQDARRIRELEAELDQFRSTERVRSVTDILTTRGMNPKIADLIPSDLRSAEEINRWLEERADVFAGVTNTPSQQQDTNPTQQVVPPANAGLMADALSAGEPIPGDESQLLAMIAAAKSPQELNRLIFGSEQGPSVY